MVNKQITSNLKKNNFLYFSAQTFYFYSVFYSSILQDDAWKANYIARYGVSGK